MNDSLALEADPYHALRAYDRDHLLAAALLDAHRDTLPPASTVSDAVGRLTSDTPTGEGTRASLTRLADAGMVERIDGKPDNRSRGVRVTDDGFRALARGAARLDAAATVEGGE